LSQGYAQSLRLEIRPDPLVAATWLGLHLGTFAVVIGLGLPALFLFPLLALVAVRARRDWPRLTCRAAASIESVYWHNDNWSLQRRDGKILRHARLAGRFCGIHVCYLHFVARDGEHVALWLTPFGTDPGMLRVVRVLLRN